MRVPSYTTVSVLSDVPPGALLYFLEGGAVCLAISGQHTESQRRGVVVLSRDGKVVSPDLVNVTNVDTDAAALLRPTDVEVVPSPLAVVQTTRGEVEFRPGCLILASNGVAFLIGGSTVNSRFSLNLANGQFEPLPSVGPKVVYRRWQLVRPDEWPRVPILDYEAN